MENNPNYELRARDFIPIAGAVNYEERNHLDSEGKFKDPRVTLRHSFLHAYNLLIFVTPVIAISLEAIIWKH